jgi:NADPH:quinone reductase-like Zn-dependent oxidoreductase
MKAVVQERYGSPDELVLRDVEPPGVADDEVLVRVRAASVHPDVWHVVTGRPTVLRLMGNGLRRPRHRVPGTDMAGVVETAGAGVTRFRPGDEVFGETLRGHQWRNGGAYAEYVAVREEVLARKPAGVTFEQAAVVPTAGYITLANLRGEPGRVLVNGAGGGVGMLAVQIAKARGAHVTGVDRAEKLDLVRSLGADQVLDAREDFTRAGARYDLIFDIPGNRPFPACRRALTPAGKYVLIGHNDFGRQRWLGTFLGVQARTPFSRHLAFDFSQPGKRETIDALAALLESGAITPVIDRTFALGEVPAAIGYLASGQARGRIVIAL